MRLIDADALGICKANRNVFDKPEYADGWNSAVAIVEDAPTVDAVEVVRCKDCVHLSQVAGSASTGEGMYACEVWEHYTHNGDCFCSYGEKGDKSNE